MTLGVAVIGAGMAGRAHASAYLLARRARPRRPYFSGGLAMDAQGVGVGQNEGFGYQARASSRRSPG